MLWCENLPFEWILFAGSTRSPKSDLWLCGRCCASSHQSFPCYKEAKPRGPWASMTEFSFDFFVL